MRAFLVHLPNIITVSRGLAGLFGAWLLLQSAGAGLEENAVYLGLASGIVFALAALTDWLDGALARSLDAQSALGALLDPIADKMLTGAYLAAFVLISGTDPWLTAPVAIILVRDIAVTGLRLAGPARQAGSYAVTAEAKAKTALTMLLVALPFVLVALGFDDVGRWFYIWVGGVWLAAALTVWSALPYVRAASRRH
ncbi:MAG: CDP-alcohol phosphatidyltransferase family protein [Glycocaulis sp.]